MIHVVIALILENGRVCVGQRKKDPFRGYFECPGGKVEEGESLLDALHRELYEEGHALIKETSYISHYDVTNDHGNFRMHWFNVKLASHFEPIVYDAMEWVTLNDLSHLNWIPHNVPYLPLIQAIESYPLSTKLKIDPKDEDEKNIHIVDAYFKQEGILKQPILNTPLEQYRPKLQKLIRFYPFLLIP